MEWWRYFSCCCRTLVWITLDWIIVAIHEDMTGKENKKRTRRNFVWLCLLSFVAGPLSLSRLYRRRSKFSIHGAPSALSSFLEMIPPLLWNAIPKTILVVFNEAKSLSLLLRVRTPGKRRISLVSIGRGCVSLVVSHVGEQWWTVLFPFFFFFSFTDYVLFSIVDVVAAVWSVSMPKRFDKTTSSFSFSLLPHPFWTGYERSHAM